LERFNSVDAVKTFQAGAQKLAYNNKMAALGELAPEE